MKVILCSILLTAAALNIHAQRLPLDFTQHTDATPSGVTLYDPASAGHNPNAAIYALGAAYSAGDTLYLSVEGAVPPNSEILVCAATPDTLNYWMNNWYHPAEPPVNGGRDDSYRGGLTAPNYWTYHTKVYVPLRSMSYTHIALVRQYVAGIYQTNHADAFIASLTLDSVMHYRRPKPPVIYFDEAGRIARKGGIPVARPQDLPAGVFFCPRDGAFHINQR